MRTPTTNLMDVRLALSSNLTRAVLPAAVVPGRRPPVSAERVPHHLGLDHVDDHLGDVGRVIGYALEETGDQDQPDRSGDGPRVLHHVRQEFAEDLIPKGVHPAVLAARLARQHGVTGYECVEALLENLLRSLRHPREVDVRLELRLAVELDRALGDVPRLIAAPFKVSDA